MRKSSLAIVFCFLSLSVTYATVEDRGLEVRPAEGELVETEARNVATVVFRVTNPTDKEREFISEVTLPEGWKLITEDFPFFKLGPEESITKLVSFFVPETTPAGSYKIKYLVRARKDPAVRDFYTVDVTVLPPGKEEEEPEAPQYVIAGQDYDVHFLVFNKSESENTVRITVDSSEDIPFTVDAPEFTLGAGQSKVVTVTIKPEATVAKKLKYQLKVTAQIGEAGQPETQDTVVHSIEIIPRPTGAEMGFDKTSPLVRPQQKIALKKKLVLRTATARARKLKPPLLSDLYQALRVQENYSRPNRGQYSQLFSG